jgi:hypothetical protein
MSTPAMLTNEFEALNLVARLRSAGHAVLAYREKGSSVTVPVVMPKPSPEDQATLRRLADEVLAALEANPQVAIGVAPELAAWIASLRETQREFLFLAARGVVRCVRGGALTLERQLSITAASFGFPPWRRPPDDEED